MELSDFNEIASAVPSDFQIVIEDSSNNQINIRRVVVDFKEEKLIIQLEDY